MQTGTEKGSVYNWYWMNHEDLTYRNNEKSLNMEKIHHTIGLHHSSRYMCCI